MSSHDALRSRTRPPDFAPSSKTPGGYVGQAVLDWAFWSGVGFVDSREFIGLDRNCRNIPKGIVELDMQWP
jgi:hypothetical protein